VALFHVGAVRVEVEQQAADGRVHQLAVVDRVDVAVADGVEQADVAADLVQRNPGGGAFGRAGVVAGGDGVASVSFGGGVGGGGASRRRGLGRVGRLGRRVGRRRGGRRFRRGRIRPGGRGRRVRCGDFLRRRRRGRRVPGQGGQGRQQGGKQRQDGQHHGELR